MPDEIEVLAEAKRQLEETNLRQTEIIASLQEANTALTDRVRAYENFYTEHDSTKTEIQTVSEQLKKDLSNAQSSIETHTARAAEAADREETLKDELSDLKAELFIATAHVDDLTDALSGAQISKNQLDKNLTEIREANTNLQHRLDEALSCVDQNNIELADLRTQLESLNKDKVSLEQTIQEQASQIEQSEARVLEAQALAKPAEAVS